MKILHYALGFPPYRTGGMTKFCMDLMKEQNKNGHQTALMWPGQMGFIKKKVSIKDRGIVVMDGDSFNIHSYEIINPLPVSYDEGIREISKFTKDDGKEAYSRLLDIYQPDVIHVHTLMGIHKSFLVIAKEKGIRLIFTAHDYFPICPKVTMFRHGIRCTSVQSYAECGACNTTALGIKKIYILQSPVYRQLKDFVLVKKLRKQHRDNYLSESLSDKINSGETAGDFKKLREYYYSLLKLMDIIHYNSTVTKEVYESVFNLPKNCIINITHADISDHRKIKKFSNTILRIRYLGPYRSEKGFFLLKAALDKLWNERQNFCLDIHFSPAELSPYIKVHNRYTYNELEEIFNKTDILITPSIWYETFGYTTLEALSYGIPVIISGTVGAKDILYEGAGIIVDDITSDKLYQVIRGLTIEKLKTMNKVIVESQIIMTLSDMAEQIEKIYLEMVK